MQSKLPSSNNYDDGLKKGKKKGGGLKAPKGATKAFTYFANERRDGMVKANKGMSTKDVNGLLQKEWKEISKVDKKKYVELAAEDRERFVREKKEYEEERRLQEEEANALEMYYTKQKQDLAMEFYEAHIEAQKVVGMKKGKGKGKKDPDAPKRPMSSYMYFANEKREEVKKGNPKLSVTEVTKVLGEQWGKLREAGKGGTKKYDQLAAKDSLRYQKEKEAYDEAKVERDLGLEQERSEQLEKDKAEAMKLLAEKNAGNETDLKKEESVSSKVEAVEREQVSKVVKRTSQRNARKGKTVSESVESDDFDIAAPHTVESAKPKKKAPLSKKAPASKKVSAPKKAPAPKKTVPAKKATAPRRTSKRTKSKDDEPVDASVSEPVQEEEEIKESTKAPAKKETTTKAPAAKGIKKPTSAYFFFTAENRDAVKASLPEKTKSTEVMKELGAKWRALDEKAKAKYVAMAEKDKLRYQKETAKAGKK